MNLDDRITQLVRDALDPMLAEQLTGLEERLSHRLAEVIQGAQAPPSPPPLLKPVEVAKRLQISTRTVQRMVEEGRFPSPIQLGSNTPRWRPHDIEEWLEAQEGER